MERKVFKKSGRLVINSLILVTICLLNFTYLSASSSRMGALGNLENYLRDDSEISTYPSLMNFYSNQACAEIGSDSTDYAFSAIIKSNENYNIGIKINPADFSIYMFDLHNPLIYNHLLRKIEFLISHDSGLGFGIGYMGNKYENSSINEDYLNYNNYKFSGKYFDPRISYSNDKLDLALAVPFYMSDEDYDEHVNNVLNKRSITNSGLDININSRYFIRNDRYELIPSCNFYLKNLDYESKIVGTSSKYTVDTQNYTFNLGLAFHKQYNDYLDLTIAYNPYNYYHYKRDEKSFGSDSKTKSKATTTSNALRIGIESKFNKYFTGRLGAQNYDYTYDKDYDHYTDTVHDYNESELTTYEQYNVYLGFAVNIKSFTIDALFNEKMLTDGPNLISGETNSLNSKVSLTYKF